MSFLQVSNPIERLRAIQQRGGRVIVVDPRRTETAKVASEHVFIRPGSDVFFFLSFLQEMFATGGVDRAKAAGFMTGAEEVERLVASWPPERTGGRAGEKRSSPSTARRGARRSTARRASTWAAMARSRSG
jgi:anaerobic selenocysteine-containing dehydrogenase